MTTSECWGALSFMVIGCATPPFLVKDDSLGSHGDHFKMGTY